MKKLIKYQVYLILIMSVLCLACKKDYFSLEDKNGLDGRLWSNEGAIQYYLNEAYDKIIPPFPDEYTANNFEIHLETDESYFGANSSWGKKVFGLNGELQSNDIRYVGAKYQGTNIGDNRYFDIDRCNNIIKNVPLGDLPDDSKKKLLGQAYTLRAIVYFELTKLYGGMPLLLEPQNPSNLTVGGRQPAKKMFAQIVSDLDSGMVYLDGVTWNAAEYGKLTKEAAAAMKAKALLYWASPQFNPENDGIHTYDAGRWQTAFKASEEAYNICLATGHGLLPKYGDIFLKEGPANTEALIVRSYSSTDAKWGHNVEAKVRPASEGGSPSDYYYASTNLINDYTMKDGTPIDQSDDYDPVLFWKDRDPRFDATIAWNGCVWPLSGNDQRRQWTYVKATGESGDRGFYCRRFATPNLIKSAVGYSNDYGGSGMDWIQLRFAEVILNYAETANETGNLSLAKDLVRQLRKRAGIEEGTKDYGLDYATNKGEMRELITKDRMVEFAFEAKRCDDLRRLRLLTKLQGTISSLHFEVANNLIKQLETVTAGTNTLYRETLDMNNRDTVLKYFKYPYTEITPGGNGTFSAPDNYYFYSLANQFINSSPLLEQTIGWDGGTFDPLK
ncbi:MAG TPA: RagB/SusD family nutrient uptake outer membrane protein [Arachidicoccus sp.]|nr:RagB/SusD family nutrient uptake outer membrane protein [Arachidicoccus sp.]